MNECLCYALIKYKNNKKIDSFENDIFFYITLIQDTIIEIIFGFILLKKVNAKYRIEFEYEYKDKYS